MGILSKEQYKRYLQREEMREQFEKEKITTVNKRVSKMENWSLDENENKPKYLTECENFTECAFCFKCSNYNSAYEDCRNCELHNVQGVCTKTELHTERNKAMLISKNVIKIRKQD